MEVQTADLTTLVEAWNSGDVAAIRSLYADKARYFGVAELAQLKRQEPIDVLVADATFERRIAEQGSLRLRILGQPIMFYDKLVAYLCRWEGDAEGFNGAGLLRYEGDKILLHAVVAEQEPTANPMDDAALLTTASLDALMQVWTDLDQAEAADLYADNAVILADEDLLEVWWRDFSDPPDIADLFRRFANWDPVIVNTPVRLGSLVICAWHWTATDYPAGYGLRLIQYDDTRIAVDLRIAIRPWEPGGKDFISGG